MTHVNIFQVFKNMFLHMYRLKTEKECLSKFSVEYIFMYTFFRNKPSTMGDQNVSTLELANGYGHCCGCYK